MKITVRTLADFIFALDVSEDLELENFKAFCEVKTGFPAPEIIIVHNGRPLLENKKSLKDYGIHDNDIVVLQHMLHPSHDPSVVGGGAGQQAQGALSGLDFSGTQVPSANRTAAGVAGRSSSSSSAPTPPISVGPEDDPAKIKEMFLSHPDQLALLKQNNPKLADALLSGSLENFSTVLREQIAARVQRHAQRLLMMQADLFDTEAQRMIAEEIRQKNIEANIEAAIEYNPETFGTVVMLYINCKINGFPVKAFIDSGAQSTIMSAACAERCNIMRLVDSRWAGIAKGVGVQRIIGRIHMVQMQIENDFLTTSFSVLEQQPMDMLLGLDMLKSHQCNIDLQRGVLRIGTTGTETLFLAENELPECARLTSSPEETLKQLGESVKDVEDLEIREAIERSKKEQASTSSDAGQSTSFSVPANTTAQPKTSAEDAPILPTDNFVESDVSAIVKLGFKRELAIAELRAKKGDRVQATAALFAKSLKF